MLIYAADLASPLIKLYDLTYDKHFTVVVQSCTSLSFTNQEIGIYVSLERLQLYMAHFCEETNSKLGFTWNDKCSKEPMCTCAAQINYY